MRSETSKSSKRSVQRFSRDSVKVLTDWLSTHLEHPYPAKNETEELVEKTKLTSDQILLWFSNARRRGKANPLLDQAGQSGRRRRRQPSGKAVHSSIADSPRPFQCTFCTKTFKFKHDWKRHEKSLHLVLEQWVCGYNVSTGGECAFCGFHNADDEHYKTHKFTICQEKSLEKRTFYRKDHLHQHLRLMHGCQFLASTMNCWKIATPRIRSRCGFCGFKMDTWKTRTDHLTDHFKSGKSMADWQGSWGFDTQVQKLVENGISPDLIHSKRISAATQEPPLQAGGGDSTSLAQYQSGSMHPEQFPPLSQYSCILANEGIRQQQQSLIYSNNDPQNLHVVDNNQWLPNIEHTECCLSEIWIDAERLFDEPGLPIAENLGNFEEPIFSEEYPKLLQHQNAEIEIYLYSLEGPTTSPWQSLSPHTIFTCSDADPDSPSGSIIVSTSYPRSLPFPIGRETIPLPESWIPQFNDDIHSQHNFMLS